MTNRARVVGTLLSTLFALLIGGAQNADAATPLNVPLFKRAVPSDTTELSLADSRSNTGTARAWIKGAFTSRYQALMLHDSGDWATSWLPRDWHPNTWVYRKSTSYLGIAGVQNTYPQHFVKLRNTTDFAAVNYDCGSGGCSQPLLDVTKQTARDFWLRGADNVVYNGSNCVGQLGNEYNGILDQLACGFEGVWLDDVLADLQTSANLYAPSNVANYRTGVGVSNSGLSTSLPFTGAAWADGLATMIEQLRAGITGLKNQGRLAATAGTIATNFKWSSFGFAESPRTGSGPTIGAGGYSARIIRASDLVELEHGFIDRGLVSGPASTSWSFARKRLFVQQVHVLGRPVIQEKTNSGDAPDYPYGNCQKDHAQENWADVVAHYATSNYNYASTLLDYVPGDWVGDLCEHVALNWVSSKTGYSTSGSWPGYARARDGLGQPTGAAYTDSSNGLLRRNFQNGYILVAPPGTPTKTITLPAPVGVIAEHHGFPASSGRTFTIGQREALMFRTAPY